MTLKITFHKLLFCLILATGFTTTGQAQNWLWAKSAPGSGSGYQNKASSLGVDYAGNVYITGRISDTVSFGTNILDRGMFLAKYDSSGSLIWAKESNSLNNYEEGKGISVDSAGNSYVVGFFSSPTTWGSITLTPTLSDGFIAKYDASGNVAWVKQTGGNKNEYVNAIAIDNSGNIYSLWTS